MLQSGRGWTELGQSGDLLQRRAEEEEEEEENKPQKTAGVNKKPSSKPAPRLKPKPRGFPSSAVSDQPEQNLGGRSVPAQLWYFCPDRFSTQRENPKLYKTPQHHTKILLLFFAFLFP